MSHENAMAGLQTALTSLFENAHRHAIITITISPGAPGRLAGDVRPLTPTMISVANLLSRDKPAKVDWLAMKLGKKSGGSFRSLCSSLVRLGVARHEKGLGYYLV